MSPIVAGTFSISISEMPREMVVNNDFVNDAGLDPESALFEDNPNSPAAQPYINVFVVREADARNERLLKLGVLGVRMQSAITYALEEIQRLHEGLDVGRVGGLPDDVVAHAEPAEQLVERVDAG